MVIAPSLVYLYIRRMMVSTIMLMLMFSYPRVGKYSREEMLAFSHPKDFSSSNCCLLKSLNFGTFYNSKILKKIN